MNTDPVYVPECFKTINIYVNLGYQIKKKKKKKKKKNESFICKNDFHSLSSQEQQILYLTQQTEDSSLKHWCKKGRLHL